MRYKEFMIEYVSAQDLEQIEKHINDVWDKDNVEINLHRKGREEGGDSHFLYRVNDPRNKPAIKPEEIEDVFMAAHEYTKPRNKLKHMQPGKEAVLVDPSSRVNIPVIADKNKNRETKIIPKTVMRKKDFLTGPSAEKINLPTDTKKPEHQKFKGSSFDAVDKNADKIDNSEPIKQNKYNDEPKNMMAKPKFKVDPSRIGKF
jgi:hypothetical protein